MLLLRRVLCFGLLCCSVFASASDFVISKVEIIGLQHISLDTAMSYLPVRVGDRISSAQTSDIIKTLYKTGFFSDVTVDFLNTTLLVKVTEQAIIADINVSGNKQVNKKELFEGFKKIGLAKGQTFDAATLKKIEQDLVQQYYNLGYHNVSVKTKAVNEKNNRVSVNIDIDEGPETKIRTIKIIGNHAFKEKTLLKNFELSKAKFWAVFSSSDKYAQEKLDADLERLHSFYLDHGYLHFKIDDKHVSISPDKKHIDIVVNITEGAVYTIKGFDVKVNITEKSQEIAKLVTLKRGAIFSRKDVMAIVTEINMLLGKLGYASPDIKTQPEIDEHSKQLYIKFIVNSGNRTYVRRVGFSGNVKTSEAVLRREIRQHEGSLFSLDKVNESKRRLANLIYLENIDTKIEPLPEYPDHVDLTYIVKEGNSASANFQVGYSDANGMLYGISVDEHNFLGTGKDVAVAFDNSQAYRTYRLSYLDPHFTENVSLQNSIYAQRHTPGSVHLSSYTTDIYGATFMFGFPLSDFSDIYLGGGYENTELKANTDTSQTVYDFIKGNGNKFNQIKVNSSWIFSNTDKAIFPNKGLSQALSLEVGLPAFNDSLQYYTLSYNVNWYQPLISKLILRSRAELAYGGSTSGKTHNLPFFKNYFAGGIGSVRGYEPGSLGPLDSNGNAIGGNVLADASLGVIFPNPGGDAVRTTAFVDAGNVYNDELILSDIRSSYGVQCEWRSPLGVMLVFSFSKPLKHKASDSLDAFQFNMGANF